MFERLFLVIRLETENIKVGKVERFCIFAEKICDITISFILKRSKTRFSMDDTIGL